MYEFVSISLEETIERYYKIINVIYIIKFMIVFPSPKFRGGVVFDQICQQGRLGEREFPQEETDNHFYKLYSVISQNTVYFCH